MAAAPLIIVLAGDVWVLAHERQLAAAGSSTTSGTAQATLQHWDLEQYSMLIASWEVWLQLQPITPSAAKAAATVSSRIPSAAAAAAAAAAACSCTAAAAAAAAAGGWQAIKVHVASCSGSGSPAAELGPECPAPGVVPSDQGLRQHYRTAAKAGETTGSSQGGFVSSSSSSSSGAGKSCHTWDELSAAVAQLQCLAAWNSLHIRQQLTPGIFLSSGGHQLQPQQSATHADATSSEHDASNGTSSCSDGASRLLVTAEPCVVAATAGARLTRAAAALQQMHQQAQQRQAQRQLFRAAAADTHAAHAAASAAGAGSGAEAPHARLAAAAATDAADVNCTAAGQLQAQVRSSWASGKQLIVAAQSCLALMVA
ncbi:hypothetical protein COO60DRAFT_1704742 [Scenedesmus sp. NREL 46B-D3]|nr:hypothetical protein COO60DRAFT_1704742 [Scenedesmus sp. NREL 46B-D3]